MESSLYVELIPMLSLVTSWFPANKPHAERLNKCQRDKKDSHYYYFWTTFELTCIACKIELGCGTLKSILPVKHMTGVKEELDNVLFIDDQDTGVTDYEMLRTSRAWRSMEATRHTEEQ